MRLNEKTFPSYHTLESGKYQHLNIDAMFETFLGTSDKLISFLDSIKFTYQQVAKRYYLTNTFREAILTAMPKIVEGQKHYNEIPTDCGIVFTDNGFSLYLSNPTDKQVKLLVFGFTRDCLTTYGVIDNNGNYHGIACSIKDGKPYNDTQALVDYLHSFLIMLYFIHNCEIEQKVLKPNDKHRENGNKHFNESKSNLIVLDCKWFTDLIREAPFHVKGHLRWQHHGQGFKKRKLIWINEFEKSGYRRTATKTATLNNQS